MYKSRLSSMSSGEKVAPKEEVTLESRYAELHDARNMREQYAQSQGKVPMADQTMLEDYPKEGHLVTAVSYINRNPKLEDEDLPNGTLRIYDVKAKVTPDALPNNFSVLVSLPIKDNADKPEGYKDSDFETEKVRKVLDQYAPQYSAKPVSLHYRDVETNYDAERWTPELGQENAFAGIYKKMMPNKRDAKYYIVVQAGAPKACAELKEAIVNAPQDMTFGELVEDPQLAYVQLAARRNAKRIAAELAFQLGLKVDKDVDAHAYAPTRFMAKPQLAEPTTERDGAQQSISSVRSMLYCGKPVVGVFHGVRSVDEARKRNYVASNPYDGITVFNMENQPRGFAVPANTGYQVLPEKAKIGADIARRHRGMLFEPAAPSQQYLKELASGVHHDVDDEFLRGMRQVGWKQKRLGAMHQLIPVVVKVANVEKKREL